MEAIGTQHVLETPLADVHRNAGAKMGVWFCCALPDDFGDWQREYFLAKQSVALVDKNHRAFISFTGPDRARYLNAILTNNIKDLQPSQGCISLLLNPQGRILAEIETRAESDKLFCVSYGMIRERLIETLEKFIIMDDVTLTDETERYGTLSLEGPDASKVVHELAGIDLGSLGETASAEVKMESISCAVTRKTFGGLPGADILIARENLESMWNILLEKTKSAGGGPMGYTALNALRLEQGVPWFGYDFGDNTKGCYTGQEIVERVRSRGQVNRRRVELIFPGSRVPPANEVLTADGKEVGFVTRASALPSRPFAIGMGYLRKENNAIGSEVAWAGGIAKVAKFPDALHSEDSLD
jgi:glycine cleavage system aminomethyltransferase T